MSDTTIKDILGNVSFINMGQSPDSIYYNEEGNGLPLIQGNADIKERKSIKRFFTSQITKVCDEGDILMTVRAPVGYVGVASFQSCVGRGVCSIKADGVDTKYLFYLLIQNEDKWKAFEAGTTFSAVTSKEVYNFPLLLTKSKTEQRQIAKILSTADAVIEKTQAAIAKYKAIKQGMLQDLFTRGIDLNTNKLRPRYKDAPELYKESKLGMIPREWEVESIDSIGEIVTGSTPQTARAEYYGDDFLFVSPADIQDNFFIHETGKNLTQSGFDVTRKLPENSICVVCIGSTIGKMALLAKEGCTNQQINSVICFDPELSFYFFYAMMLYNEPQFRRETGLQAVPIVNKSQFSEFLLPVAEKTEALKISERLAAIDNKFQTEQTYLQKMQSLKKGLMEDLLSGKKQVKVTEEVNA